MASETKPETTGGCLCRVRVLPLFWEDFTMVHAPAVRPTAVGRPKKRSVTDEERARHPLRHLSIISMVSPIPPRHKATTTAAADAPRRSFPARYFLLPPRPSSLAVRRGSGSPFPTGKAKRSGGMGEGEGAVGVGVVAEPLANGDGGRREGAKKEDAGESGEGGGAPAYRGVETASVPTAGPFRPRRDGGSGRVPRRPRGPFTTRRVAFPLPTGEAEKKWACVTARRFVPLLPKRATGP